MIRHCRRQNFQCIQVVFTVYEISNIFNFKRGHIVHITGSMEVNVNGFHDIYWNASLKEFILQRGLSEWEGFM